jgi:hypothetical protein
MCKMLASEMEGKYVKKNCKVWGYQCMGHKGDFFMIIWDVMLAIARSEHDGYCAETSFRLWVKRSSPFKLAGVSAHSAAQRQGGSIWQAVTCLSLSNSWVTHSIPLITLSSPFLVHLCAITFRMRYTLTLLLQTAGSTQTSVTESCYIPGDGNLNI